MEINYENVLNSILLSTTMPDRGSNYLISISSIYMKVGGAGILIIEQYMGTNVITLFGGRRYIFEDLGGKLDKGETPEEGACREAQEESANLLTIRPHELLKISKVCDLDGFLSYIIYVTGLKESVYKKNVQQIFKKCKSKHWKETRKMTRIPLDAIINSTQQYINIVPDINGKQRTIRDRTSIIIRKSVHLIKSMIQSQPHTLVKKEIMKSKMRCLIGTKTFRINKYSFSQQGLHNYSNQFIQKATTGYPGRVWGTQYAIFIAPRLTQSSSPYLLYCNKQWGGMHITLVGFNSTNPEILNHLPIMAYGSGTNQQWSINVQDIITKRTSIHFNSKTLDKLANHLAVSGFANIKGPRFASQMWHMSSECAVPYNIRQILMNTGWDLVKVSNNNGMIQWHERYPLMI